MSAVQTISAAVLLGFLMVVFVSMFYEKIARISPTPTLPWVRKKIVLALKARLSSEKKLNFAELGCGWGGMNLILAKNYPNSLVTGYEISFFPYLFSKIRGFIGSDRINIVQKSFFDTDLSGYNVIICYLSPWHMNALIPSFVNLSAGTIIVSNGFAIPHRIPQEVLETNVGMKIPIYIYVAT